MSWYTELKIGKHDWSWYKTLPAEVPILFLKRHKMERGLCSKGGSSTAQGKRGFVGFYSTVAGVKHTLDSLGLTRKFFESLYHEYRDSVAGEALSNLDDAKRTLGYFKKRGKMPKGPGLRLKDVQRWKRQIEIGNASSDFGAAVALINELGPYEWKLANTDATAILPVFRYDIYDIPRLSFSAKTIKNMIPASLLGSFIENANRHLPEIGFLMEVRVVLESYKASTSVRLDLSEWQEETGWDINEVLSYAIETLSEKVNAYQRTFDAILGGQETIRLEIARKSLHDKWERASQSKLSNYEKGHRLELFLATIIEAVRGLQIVRKNVRTETQELDLVVKNVVRGIFWQSLNSPFILIECKNWSQPVGTSEARVFESKLRQAGPRFGLGIFVATNGVTGPFSQHLASIRREGITAVVITNNDIGDLLSSTNVKVAEWLEELITNQVTLGS